ESARLEQQDQRDPQLISIFLAEGMDILLDAEDLLRKWREHPSEQQELSALLEELTTLGRGAEMAELPQIDELCQALLALYQAVLDRSEEHTSELQSRENLVCRLLLEKKKTTWNRLTCNSNYFAWIIRNCLFTLQT